jgi:hypothetical protein
MGTIGKDFDYNFTQEKMGVEGLLLLIEENNGAEGLNLSGKDFSGIKLNPEILNGIRQDRKLTECPVWQNANGGINLAGASLSWVSLVGADLSDGCLRGVDLRGARLEGVDLIDTDLSHAILWDADFDSATLDGANLRGANIFGASFTNATINKESIGENVIQESHKYSLPSGMDMLPERNRFWQASKIYRGLKTTFDSNGLYGNASWAYRRARKMEKHLAKYHAREAYKTKQWHIFLKNSLKWLSDTVVEAVSDYGESPWRVLLWINIIWIGFAVIYGLFSGVVNDAGVATSNAMDLLAFSLGTMTTLVPEGLSANNNIELMRFLMPFEVLLGIALTGLFGFVLGNRINRA